MARKNETLYTLGFAGAICIVCSILVSVSAVSLKEMQTENQKLDKRLNVLRAAGLVDVGAKIDATEINRLMDEKVKTKAIDLKSGAETTAVDPNTYDARLALVRAETSRAAPDNDASIARIANVEVVYEVRDGSRLDMVVLPVTGKGLWSTLYGFLAVDADCNTVRGISFYAHGETPGLGGEIENPKWQAKWPNRKLFGADGQVELEVIKGKAAGPDSAPHQIDGLSGATLTSKGVSNLVRFWAGEHGFGPYLQRLKSEGRNR